MTKEEIDKAFAPIDNLIARAEALYDTPGSEAQIYALLYEAIDLGKELVVRKLSEKLPLWMANKLANALSQLQEFSQ